MLSTSTLLDKEEPNDLNPDSSGKFKLLPIMVYNNKTKISLGMLVHISKDRHEKNGDWILRTTKHPKICFVWEKQTEKHF